MTPPDPPAGIRWTFTQPCPSCDKPVQVTNGIRESHPDCAPPPVLVIEGCNASTPLAERVEQALADQEVLTALAEESA